MADNDIPRRAQMLKWTPAERAIQHAVDEVERMGADVSLTTAVVKLGEARSAVADFVDLYGAPPETFLPDEPILQFFEYQHLPPHLAIVSAPFRTVALNIVAALPRNPERTVALRKLLESKDAAVRARLYK
jgi:hypothetical protein